MPEAVHNRDSPLFWSIKKLSDAYRKRELSPLEVTEEALQRIDLFDPQLHAFLSRCDALARSQALEAEQRYKKNETPLLCGIPVSIKDTFHLKDHITTFGSRVYEDNLSGHDSGVVRRLRAAGAVFTGKTNTSEFAQSATAENRFYVDSRNPWDLDRSCGGSSGGAAASVAAGLCTSGVGADGGGSIRIPAAFTGLYGIKPGYGLCQDEQGLSAMRDFISPGPFSRCVADARIMMSVLAEFEYKRTTAGPGLRIAWCPRPGNQPHEAELVQLVENAVLKLSDMGHSVEEIEFDIAGWEMAFNPLVLHNEHEERHELLDKAELLTGYERRSLEAASELTEKDIELARQAHRAYRQKIHDLFKDYDLLACPSTATPAFPVGRRPDCIDGQEVHWLWGAFPCTAPFNVSGNPAANLPVGLANNLPVGLQLVTAMKGEALLMDVSESLEEALAFDYSRLHTRWADNETAKV